MTTETKILIVEHDLQDIELLEYELKKGGIRYISKVVQNEEEYIAALQFFLPDIIVSDYSFPLFDGLSAFNLRETMAPDIPFIFVSGAIGEENSVDLIKKGVTDFVLKDKLFTLCFKITRALTESNERRDKDKAEQDLTKSENRLSRAQQLAHMGSWEFNLSTNEFFWSEETCRICGIPPPQSKQSFMAALAFIHPIDLNLVIKEINRTRKARVDPSMNFRIVNRAGMIRYIYLEGKFEFDSAGTLTGIHGIIHDITATALLENKLVEERLSHQRKITEAVMTAQENERAFIGYELQENISQVLAASKIYMKLASTNVNHRKIYLNKSCMMVQDAIEELRKISNTLVIPKTAYIGLFGRIRDLLHDMHRINSIIIDFHANNIEEELLNEKLQLTIFRIVQEQVGNIVKHAKARMADISLNMQHNQIILQISDNGRGCELSKTTNGVGIINIRSRTEAYRGNLSILSRPGEGYKLQVALPMNFPNN